MKKLLSFLLFLTMICLMNTGFMTYADDLQPQQGMYEIVSTVNPDYVLDLAGFTGSENDQIRLQLFHALDVNQQKFYLEQEKNHTWRISSLLNGSAISHVSDADTADDTDAAASAVLTLEPLEHKAGASAPKQQLWTLKHTGDGSYYICTEDDLYLTMEGSRCYNCADVVLSSFHGENSQKWIFRKTWLSEKISADTDLFNPYEKDGRYENLSMILRIREFGKDEVIDHETIASWITINEEDRTLQTDTDAIRSFVSGIADQYNTIGKPKTFTSTSGQTFPLFKGNYGWELDEEDTVQQILSSMHYNTTVILTPSWKKTAATPVEGNDVGDSYVEVDLTNQKVWLYKEGKQILETDCVTGTYATDRQTPGGIYSIAYKQSPAVLNGPGYSTPVTFWMPFNGGIGLHDATWRGSFGGNIFRSDGSHGCVNLPYDAAKKIYETVTKGYPVVCYN